MKLMGGRHMQKANHQQLGLFTKTADAPRPARTPRAINRQAIEIALGIITAETWPSRYKLHKYWGRKPANIVSQYIEFFSHPDDVILDPFAGSGVTVVEGARLGRRTIGFDLNPFAVRLTKAMLNPPNSSDFEAAALWVLETATRYVGHLYTTQCDHCCNRATLRSVGYAHEEMQEVRYACPHCGRSGTREPSAADRELAAKREEIPENTPDAEIFFGWEMQKLKRRGLERWRDLFTHRNFVAAAHLRRAILTVEREDCRDWLLISFTASLAQFTRMIADFSGDAGGPSWKINCYWVPPKWQELNPLWYFENRTVKSLQSLRDLIDHGAPFSHGKVEVCDSRQMPLDKESVDYIFTDPPYGGEGIQYGELSMLWCLWLAEQQDLASEIAFNPYRKLDQEHYARGLELVFAECFRVLKPGKWMTVTFANKEPSVWDALMHACRKAGFSLLSVAPMKRSAPSLTETTMHTAPKADLVLSFEKPIVQRTASPVYENHADYSLKRAVERIAVALRDVGKSPTAHDVFDRITVDWFSWFYENGGRPNALQPTLANVESTLSALGLSSSEIAPKQSVPVSSIQRKSDREV